MKSLDIIDSNALELCARKVAAVSGDVRKALQICRHVITPSEKPDSLGILNVLGR